MKRYSKTLLFILVIVILIGITQLQIIQQAILQIGVSVERIGFVGGNSLHTLISGFKNAQQLYEENISLKKEITQLKLQQFNKIGERDGNTFSVLSSPNRTPYDTLIIDGGQQEGVQKGDKVFVGDTVILGVIESVSRDYSTVSLYSSPDTEHEVVLSQTNTRVVAEGLGGGSFSIKVPKDVEVSVGETILLSEDSLPVLGVVSVIEEEVNSSFKEVSFRTPVNLSEIVEVKVFVGPSSENMLY